MADREFFRFRMVGTSIVVATGKDLTGNTLETSDLKAPLTNKICRTVASEKKPIFTRDSLQCEHLGATYLFDETVAFPLFDANAALDSILLVHGPRD